MQLGGPLFYLDTFAFMQDSYYSSLNEIGKFVGEKYIISGCVEAGNNVSDGYIVYNGERVKFIGGLNTGIVIIQEEITPEGFDDGTLKPFFYTKTATFGNTGGFPYTDLKRLPLAGSSIGDSINKLYSVVKNIVQFEPEVILEGCTVSNVLTGPSTLDISSGLVLFAGKLITTPAYSGAYPVYLKEDGGWTNAVPGAGLYITFDPHTSQRYKNVLDRATIPAGRIILEETLSDRFDGAGVGRWEMKGYQLMSAMQNRVPVGLWFDGIPSANVTDAANEVAGTQFGENRHKLTTLEQGTFNVRQRRDDIGGGTAVVTAQIEFNNVNVPTNGAPNQGGPGDNLTVSLTIATNEHENRQPSTVVVYAKRTA